VSYDETGLVAFDADTDPRRNPEAEESEALRKTLSTLGRKCGQTKDSLVDWERVGWPCENVSARGLSYR